MGHYLSEMESPEPEKQSDNFKNLTPCNCENKSVTVQQSSMEIIRNAIEQGYGADALSVLERMLDLQMKNEANEARKAYAEDMARCQQEMPVVHEKRRNNQTNSNYASYKDIVHHSRDVYTKYGFSVSFNTLPSDKDGWILYEARVLHALGHTETFTKPLPFDDKGIKGSVNKTLTHAIKSSSSYGKGMLLSEIFNIPTSDDVDDDGNAAGGTIWIDQEQQNQLNVLLTKLYGKDHSAFLNFIGKNSLDEITETEFKKHMAALNIKLKKKEEQNG